MPAFLCFILREKEYSMMNYKKAMVGFLTVMMTASAVMPAVPVLADETEEICRLQFGASGIADPVPGTAGAQAWAGDFVYLGQYSQSLDSENGEFLAEPIKWKVLDTDSSADLDADTAGDAMYLLSEQALDFQVWDSNADLTTKNISWNDSTLKPWLNDTFLAAAFSEAEQGALLVTSGCGAPGLEEAEVNGDVGEAKVFLPSAGELYRTDYGFVPDYNSHPSRALTATDYAIYLGAPPSALHVFTRTLYEELVLSWSYGGEMSSMDQPATVSGVAPAVQLDKSKVVFSEPVEGEENAWELTLSDERQSLNVTSATYKGSVATIAFDGATTGEGQQVSAVITDREGTDILAYEAIADTSEAASGSGTIALPEGFFENGYRLSVFAEKEQAGVLPDYAGALQEVTLTEAASPVEGVSLDRTSLSFSKKWEKQRLTASVDPADADNQNVTWTSSNEQVARVTEKGLVMAVNDGTADITVTTEDGQKRASCKVTVKGTKPDQTVITKTQTWGYNAAKVSWDKVYGADGYRIYRAASKNGTYQYVTQISNGSTTSYVNTGLTTGKTYYYKVRAYRTVNGSKVFGTMAEAKSVKPVPRTAVISKVTAGSKQAKVTWNKVNGASGYRLYYKTSQDGSWKYVTQIGQGSTTSYTQKGLKKGQTVYYKMRAYRTVGKEKIFGAYSAQKSVKVK